MNKQRPVFLTIKVLKVSKVHQVFLSYHMLNSKPSEFKGGNPIK